MVLYMSKYNSKFNLKNFYLKNIRTDFNLDSFNCLRRYLYLRPYFFSFLGEIRKKSNKSFNWK